MSSPAVGRWTENLRELDVAASGADQLLVVHESTNIGWVATRADGTRTATRRRGRLQQGWIGARRHRRRRDADLPVGPLVPRGHRVRAAAVDPARAAGAGTAPTRPRTRAGGIGGTSAPVAQRRRRGPRRDGRGDRRGGNPSEQVSRCSSPRRRSRTGEGGAVHAFAARFLAGPPGVHR
ncbi:hypothetical protein GS934_02255 [Rhodococcus hoagii]|nr:hypothetical protein [Prescottella equi]NKZ86920.1 hypothetical protein [Prescottella equi]